MSGKEATHKQEHPETWFNTIKNRLSEWFLDTEIHGLPNIARADNMAIRIMWTICFFISLGTCSFLVYRSINSYLEYDVNSKFDVIYEAPAVFPTVTICNQNPFITDEAFEYVKSSMDKFGITFESFVNETDMPKNELPGTQLKQSLFNAMYLAIVNTENVSNKAEFRKSMGLSIEQMIISCEFESNECSLEDDFDWHFDIYYGSCFSFGKTNTKISNKAGNYDGLILHLAVGLGNPENNYTLSMRGGAHIFIHNQSIVPTSTEGYDVAPGTSTSFIVNRQWSNKLPKPYNDCYDDLTTNSSYDSVLYREIINANLTYRQLDCFWLCYQKRNIEICTCNDLSYPPIFGARACFTKKDLDCLNDVYAKFKIDEECLNLW